MSRAPPCRECQIQHEKRSDHRSGPHPEAHQQAQANESFHDAYNISKNNRVRQNNVGQKWPVETYRFTIDVTLKIGLKAAVGKAGIKMLFPIVIFILPVLFVITLVPGMISVMHDMQTLGVGAGK